MVKLVVPSIGDQLSRCSPQLDHHGSNISHGTTISANKRGTVILATQGTPEPEVSTAVMLVAVQWLMIGDDCHVVVDIILVDG